MVWKPLKALIQPKSDIYIELDDSQHVHKSGESVTGSVIVDLIGKTDAADVLVHFKGRLRISGNISQIKAHESVIFDEKVSLLRNGALTQGKHSFPFELELPKDNLLGSSEFDVGNIEYNIRGCLESAKLKKTSEPRAVKVATTLDVAALQQPKTVSLIIDMSKKRKQRKALVKLSLPRKGWIPGERIPIKLHIQHQWNVQSPAPMAVTLSRISQFVVGKSEYTYRKDLDQSILGLYTDPETKAAELTTTLTIPPDSRITAATSVISFSYLIEVTMDISGKLDLSHWANSNPAIRIIDTDRVRGRSGVVSLWSELVIGNQRSEHLPPLTRTDTTSDVVQTANATPPSSLESSEDRRSHGRSDPSQSSRTSPYQGNENSATATEKSVLATRAQTLIPSVPQYSSPQQKPTAPVQYEEAVPLPNTGQDDKETLRLRQLASDPSPEYAPAYSPRNTLPPQELQASAPPAPSVPSAPSAPSGSGVPAISAPLDPNTVMSETPHSSQSSLHAASSYTSDEADEAVK